MSVATPCPTQTTLARLCLGQLDDGADETLASHIDQCLACQQTLEAIQHAPNDSLVQGLRSPANNGPPPDERRCRLAVARAAAIAAGGITAAESALTWNSHSGDLGATIGYKSTHSSGHSLTTLADFRDYELLAEIARGGMGIVYKARHRKLNRVVALKVQRAGPLVSPQESRRFHFEAEAAAKLDHPHIVPIYEVGEVAGQCYLTMAFVEGESLAQAIAAGPLPPRRAAELMKRVAEAVEYAHGQGVVHRDLKPANILLDAAGQPRVTDFGLAKRADTDSSLTQAGQVMGTPSYMSPEQARGKNEQVGPAADIYSLGATLYCLLTGRPPFQSATVLDTLRLVGEKEPIPPLQLNPAVDRDLNTICLKCLEKRPDRRYASAAALAEDLQRFLERRPIAARPIGRTEILARWCRRHPGAATVAGVFFLIFVAAIIAALEFRAARDRADSARQSADAARQSADTARQAANVERSKAVQAADGERWERYRSNMIAATSALELHNVSAARIALEAAPKEHRNWEWKHLYHRLDTSQHVFSMAKASRRSELSAFGEKALMIDSGERLRLWDLRARKDISAFGPNDRLWLARLSPDGRSVVFLDSGVIVVRDLDSGKRLCEVPLRVKSWDATFSPDGKRLGITIFDEKGVLIWEVATGKLLHDLRGHKDVPEAVAFSPDGKWIATAGSTDKTTRFWHADTGKPGPVIPADGRVRDVFFSQDSSRLLSVEEYPSNVVRVIDTATGKQLGVLRGHGNVVRAAAVRPDGKQIATGGLDQTVRLWDGQAYQPLATLQGHKGWIYNIAYSPDGKRLLSASQDHTVRLWDTADGTPLAVLYGHTADVMDAKFSADGATIISASNDGAVRVWNSQQVERNGVLRGHSKFVYGVAFHPDNERVASASWDGTVRLWEATTCRQLAVLNHAEGTFVTSVAFHPDGKLLASLGRDDCVRLWDIDSHTEVHRFLLPTDSWRDSRVAFSPRGDFLAAGSKDANIHVWDVKRRVEVAKLQGHRATIRDLAFAPDGKWLATASEENPRLQIWNAATFKIEHTLEGHAAGVYALAVSADGKKLASASTDGIVRLWDTESWKEVTTLKNGTPVYSLAFLPDGTRLACACANNTISFWDMATNQLVTELHGHGEYVHQVAFSSDGTRLVSSSGDKTVRVWDSMSAPERARPERKNLPH